MSAKKSVLKIFIIIILAVFLLSTWLISVLYLWGNKNTANQDWSLSWAVTESWITDETTGTVANELPEVSKEEATQKIQQLLSGITTSE